VESRTPTPLISLSADPELGIFIPQFHPRKTPLAHEAISAGIQNSWNY